LPNVTTTPGPLFSTSQLIFAGVISLVLYGSYVFVQTISHRGYFLPTEDAQKTTPPPSNAAALLSAALLLASLVAVVGLAKTLTPTLEIAVAQLDVPKSAVGVVLALLVLMPEGLAALRAARANELQTSLNLALGSALASIGLTIPRGRHHFDRAASAVGTRARHEGRGPAGADHRCRHHHLGHRSHNSPSGNRAPRDIRGISFLRRGAVGTKIALFGPLLARQHQHRRADDRNVSRCVCESASLYQRYAMSISPIAYRARRHQTVATKIPRLF
jgi:hypothetical protein